MPRGRDGRSIAEELMPVAECAPAIRTGNSSLRPRPGPAAAIVANDRLLTARARWPRSAAVRLPLHLFPWRRHFGRRRTGGRLGALADFLAFAVALEHGTARTDLRHASAVLLDLANAALERANARAGAAQ